MTRRVRMVGVVLAAVLAVAIPAIASGHSSTPRGSTPPDLHTYPCEVVPAAGTVSGGPPTARLTPQAGRGSRTHGSRRHGHLRHHRHRGSAPATSCLPPCAVGATGATLSCSPFPCAERYVTGSSGPTGVTGICHPFPCVYSAGGSNGSSVATSVCPPFPCAIPGGATGSSGTSGSTGATPDCPPVPCLAAQPSTGSGGSSGVIAPWCPPLPCLVAPAAGASGPTLCLHPPCPLGATGASTVCVCSFAHTSTSSGTAAAIVACPPVPGCPPLPPRAAANTSTTIRACPEISAAPLPSQ